MLPVLQLVRYPVPEEQYPVLPVAPPTQPETLPDLSAVQLAMLQTPLVARQVMLQTLLAVQQAQQVAP